nr:hypothetical protein GCM10023233_03490 [Brevibacterium otitidis]
MIDPSEFAELKTITPVFRYYVSCLNQTNLELKPFRFRPFDFGNNIAVALIAYRGRRHKTLEN